MDAGETMEHVASERLFSFWCFGRCVSLHYSFPPFSVPSTVVFIIVLILILGLYADSVRYQFVRNGINQNDDSVRFDIILTFTRPMTLQNIGDKYRLVVARDATELQPRARSASRKRSWGSDLEELASANLFFLRDYEVIMNGLNVF